MQLPLNETFMLENKLVVIFAAWEQVEAVFEATVQIRHNTRYSGFLLKSRDCFLG